MEFRGRWLRISRIFARHHLAETRSDTAFGDALVGGMGAVAFTEDAATTGYLVGFFLLGELDGLFEAKAHAPDLLEKEFPCSRGAFVARLDGADLAIFPDDINQESLSPGADDGIQGGIAVVDMRQGRFYGLGFGNGG